MCASPCLKLFLWFHFYSSDCPGYSGDVWNPQPAPKDHPWRYMPNQAMTPHISGTTIDAQVALDSTYAFLISHYFVPFPQHLTKLQMEFVCSYDILLELRICLIGTSREKIFLNRTTL